MNATTLAIYERRYLLAPCLTMVDSDGDDDDDDDDDAMMIMIMIIIK